MRFKFEEGGALRGVEHFLSEIKRVSGQGDFRLYFRGQGEPDNGLLPSIGRKHFYLGRSISFEPRTERALLFPDLEGLARGLWQTEIIRKLFRS